MNAGRRGEAAPDVRRSHRCQERRAFTVVELLVVSSIISLLVSLLTPAAQRAAQHARAAACQSQLRQWGTGFSMFLDEHDAPVVIADSAEWDRFWRPYCDRRRNLFLCPAATRYESNRNDPILTEREAIGCGLGSKRTAWKLALRTPASPEPGLLLGGYGTNGSGLAFLDARVSRGRKFERSHIPVLLDCVNFYSQASASDEPPACEGALSSPGDIKSWCIDRHHGAINGLFLDWSVRTVGLKELWTLDWSPWFDAHGPWTKAGGVQPNDWPRWMRACKDY